MIAEIIINNNARALNKTFDYEVPTDMENIIRVGSRIFVPFGNQKKLEDGFVINLKDSSEYECKPISKIDEADSLSEDDILLAKLMARKYFCNISECIKLLLAPGTASNDKENRVKEKTGNFVYLNIEKEEIDKLIEEKIIKNDKQQRCVKFLAENDGIYKKDLELLSDVTSSVIKTLEKNKILRIEEGVIERNPFINKDVKKDKAFKLNDEQSKCFNKIKKDIEDEVFSKNLIYGVTGSGKTEIYLQLIDEVIKNNKTAIVLVPEISLTPQMVDRFLARFGEVVAVLHSKLSNGERFDEWKRIKESNAKIVIGARSAIFAPIKNLGIIIIDEEHDGSYKSDSSPRYNAKDIAKYIAEKNNCPLVLGSATPDMITYTQAKNGDITLFKLSKRATSMPLPEIKIVDLRQELASGNRSMISYSLQNEIKKRFDEKKQTILFLNRRGYSTFVMCRDCGYVATCKNCNISLTYHQYDNKLKCHYCGYEMPNITVCPECNGNKVKYFGIGTQKLDEEIKKIFPEASTIRMDTDTVTEKNSYETILNKFKNEKIDILIGTQMVVKGHHFPNVTLVGVISADGSLNQEDYRAVERTFQTLTQVAGRSGREEKGEVIIQTYNPDHYAILDAQKQDYELFYNQEIGLRKRLNYPPFCDIILVRFQGKNINEIKKISNIFYNNIKSISQDYLAVYNPVPAPIDKMKGKYRWRIIMKGKVTGRILDMINFTLNLDPIKKVKDTSIIIDINPNTIN